MRRKTRKNIAAAAIGTLIGGMVVTTIGKTVMEFGITLLTGVAVVGSGVLLGVLTFPKKLFGR
jgi:uncharacterized protein YcfJ